jgi:hypothetical protein
MPRITLQELIAGYPNASPELVNMLNSFYSVFDSRAAANRTITNVVPLYFAGAIAGSEFVTYAATKMYIALKFGASHSSGLAGGSVGYMQFNNEADAAQWYMSNNALLLNGAANQYSALTAFQYNFYFSRIGASNSYTNLHFNGYRITLV